MLQIKADRVGVRLAVGGQTFVGLLRHDPQPGRELYSFAPRVDHLRVPELALRLRLRLAAKIFSHPLPIHLAPDDEFEVRMLIWFDAISFLHKSSISYFSTSMYVFLCWNVHACVSGKFGMICLKLP